jgi:hypothetical protein
LDVILNIQEDKRAPQASENFNIIVKTQVAKPIMSRFNKAKDPPK